MFENYNKYPKGSVWRKWDLQVQPIKGEWLSNSDAHSEKIKEATFQFIQQGGSKSLDVIGITDHNSGAAIDFALEQSDLKIIPGVELDTNEGWHLLVLFNEEYKDRHQLQSWKEAVDYFLTSTCKIQRPLFDDQNVAKKINCTTIQLLKTIANDNIGIPVFAHCCSPDGFFQQGDASGRKDVINLFIDGTAKFAFEIKNNLNHLTEIADKVKGWYNGKHILIPILSSSDAHKAADVGSTFSWIKADPTFEGLKQILYEPTERVCIQEEIPDEKKVYNVIEKVKFQDTSFTTKEIPLSENLTAIIGGKSTGKSILIKNIAKCIDEVEFNKRNKPIGLEDRKPVKGFEVYWMDNQVSKLGAGESNPNKRIIFIPQSYLNRVVDQEQETTDIDEIIKDVLLQEDDFNDWYTELNVKEKAISNSIEDNIRELYDNIEQYNSTLEELKKRGDEDGLKKQIAKIKSEIADQQKRVQLSQEEIQLYDEKSALIKENKSKVTLTDRDIAELSRLLTLPITFPNVQNFQLTKTGQAVEKLIEEKRLQYNQDWKDSMKAIIKSLSEENQEYGKLIAQAEEEIKEVKGKVESQKVLKSKFEDLESEEKKEQEIISLKKVKDQLYSNIENNITKLSDLNADYYSIYLEAKDHVSLDGLDEELDFNIATVFSDKMFADNFINRFFDGRSLRSDAHKFTSYSFESKQKHQKFINDLIWDILRNRTPLNKNVQNQKKEVITALCKNWFIHDYKVEFQGDQLIDMSPGKKSFVLLRLLIDLDNSECPILIDQPEDDLDNRSIYDDIVSFLSRRKKSRQIIIVTHNPNLVLGSDAELVIVANQEGEDNKNKNDKFEYVTGAIEHSIIEDKSIKEVLLRRGIQEHICSILEGGEEAFTKRKNKYKFSR